MLPDFPNVKNRIAEAQAERMRRTIESLLRPLDFPSKIQFEGDSQETVREDGARRPMKYTNIRVSREIDLTKFENMTIADFDKIKGELATEMARQRADIIIQEIERGTCEVGNSFDAGGQPLSPELISKAYDMIDMDFDEEGNPFIPSIVAGPDLEDQMKRVMKEIETDSALCQLRAEIIEKKRREWNDREASRKLVG